MHPSLSDQQLGCKESLWVALTPKSRGVVGKSENQTISYPSKKLLLSFLLNAETLYDGVMMASAGCILFLIYHEVIQKNRRQDFHNLFLTNFIDQDSNIWDLVLLHLWFHFPNFPVLQLRIAGHVHSEGRGRHRPHPPVVPGGCRRPYGSREQPMHCRCQGVETWRKNGLSPDPKFQGWQRLKLIFL